MITLHYMVHASVNPNMSCRFGIWKLSFLCKSKPHWWGSLHGIRSIHELIISLQLTRSVLCCMRALYQYSIVSSRAEECSEEVVAMGMNAST